MENGTDWASGYVTEVVYTQGYYRELSPLAQRFALLCAGYAAPVAENFSYCELGFGQGLSLNFHAASHPDGRFHGFDINPAHVSIAHDFSNLAQSEMSVADDSFAELLERNDLPQFDHIALHGVWSWISRENHAHVIEFMRRRLKVGGVAYLSYNCLPGWAQAMPLRRLMTDYAAQAASPAGNVIDRANEAITFAQKLADLDLGFFRGMQTVKDRLSGIAKHNRNYLVHEYFNRDWEPMYFSEVAEWASRAKATFAASANPADQLDSLRLTRDGQTLLSGIKHPLLRETVRDFLVNQQFRRDLFVRGARRISASEQRRRLDGTAFVLQRSASALMDKSSDAAKRGVQDNLREVLVQALDADEGRPKTLADIATSPGCRDFQWGALRQAVMVFVSAGDFSVALDPDERKRAKSACRRLNVALCARAGEGSETGYLCSPVTGGGIAVGGIQQMLLHALWRNPRHKADALTQSVWERLSALGQRVVSGGKTCETPEDNLAALGRIADEFLSREYPVLKRLGIA